MSTEPEVPEDTVEYRVPDSDPEAVVDESDLDPEAVVDEADGPDAGTAEEDAAAYPRVQDVEEDRA